MKKMSHGVHSRRWLQRSSSDESSTSDEAGPTTSSSSKQSGLLVKPSLGRSPSPYQLTDSKGFIPSGKGNKLAQEIHDEFLVCKICLEGYKNPKCLDCLHTFCEQCIESHVNSEPTYKKYSDYREFTCPLCRKRTQLPVGGVRKLPDNFLVSSLIEVVGRQRQSKYPFCDFCKMVSQKHREATSKCLDCAKLLCANCVLLHRNTKVTSGHSLFDVEIEKEIECKYHQDEVVRFYCEPCDACICVLCTFNEHKDHEISHFNEAVVKYKNSLQNLLTTCKQKTEKFDVQVQSLDKLEEVVKTVEQKIKDTAIQFVQEIRNQEQQLLEELVNIYGKECSELIDNKKEMAHHVENLRNTCSLTEVILLGKDMEILLLKKEVEEKLNALNMIELQGLPSTIDKVVEFISGSVDFGYIHDHDRPLLPKTRTKQVCTDGNKASQLQQTIINYAQGKISKDEGSKSVVEIAIQTDNTTSTTTTTRAAVTPIGTKMNHIDHGTMTEEAMVTDRGVNTQSTLQSFKSGAGPGSAAHSIQPAEDSADDLSDSSLAARRRRRRERSGQAGSTSWGMASQQPQQPQQHRSFDAGHLPAERRERGSTGNHATGGDVFYDAKSSISHPRRL